MALKGTQRFAYRIFGPRARKSKSLERLEESLRKAQIPVRSDAYVATAWLQSLIVAAVAFLLYTMAAAVLIPTLGLPAGLWVLVFMVPVSAGYMGYIAIMGTPGSAAKKRRKDIEAKLPYATN